MVAEESGHMGDLFGRNLGVRRLVVSAAVFFALVFASLITVQAAGAVTLPPSASPEGFAYAAYGQGVDEHPLGYSLTPSSSEPYATCGAVVPGHFQCMAIAVPLRVARKLQSLGQLSEQGVGTVSPTLEGSGVEGGFSPSDLRSAYKISETGGSGQTVAIVDAYNDPNAEADLKAYRSHYGLSECTAANGCFKKLNQKDEEANYPPANEGWAEEESLDIDMVSAICAECHIRLVEATDNTTGNLLAAESTAATLSGTTEVSNSWGGPESSEDKNYNTYFNHPGIPITAGAGDSGYGADYPAASADVIAVGGTTLEKATNSRGWEETVWSGSGGGCSKYESKPEKFWQSLPGVCGSYRNDNDVAAVANPYSPVSVYDSYEKPGWILLGGTSVGTPIIASVEAHASSTVRSEGAEAFYRHKLFDVSAGRDGQCGETRPLACHGKSGYDSPTGWGTPDGPLELSVGSAVTTAPVEAEGPSEATLVGYVSPEGLSTSYYFEYGPTSAYGTTTTTEKTTSQVWQAVTAKLTGLGHGQTYHYRLVASNSKGTIYGEDHKFTGLEWVPQKTTEPYPFKEGEFTSNGESILWGVSCKSTTECMAVGEAYDYNLQKNEGEPHGTGPIAQKWNGKEWLLESVPLPKIENDTGGLNDVSCTSANVCIAVGHTNAGMLAERWEGTKWSVQEILKSGSTEAGTLKGVSCFSSTECIAVGGNNVNAGELKAEKWNGTSWSSLTPVAAPEGASDPQLIKISCASASSCIAIGDYRIEEESKIFVRPLSEEWNGTKWSLLTTATPAGAVSTILEGVSCSSTTVCTAVGYYLTSWGTLRPLAERWNGGEKKWSIQSIQPPAGAEMNALQSVSCLSANECVATGGTPTIVLRWNGAEWYSQPTLNPLSEEDLVEERLGYETEAESGQLVSVSCSPTACAAVGLNDAGRIAGPVNEYRQLAENELYGPPALPLAETKAPTGVGSTGSTLVGVVNPYSHETKYQFEYGTTTSYGTVAPSGGASAGYGTENVEEHTTVIGLLPSTTYHFRIAASDVAGTSYGADHTFTTSGLFKFSFGSSGSVGGDLSDPIGVTTDPNGNVWVADTENDRVAEFRAGGEFVRVVGKEVNKTKVESGGSEAEKNQCTAASGNVCQAGKGGTGNGEINKPMYLAFIPSTDKFWVTEGGNNRVEEFNEKGEYLAKFGSSGTEEKSSELSEPTGIAIQPSHGEIWVSDSRYYRVKEFTSSGEFIREVGSLGEGNGQFKKPGGIAIDKSGDVWVADAGHNRVQELSSTGEYLSKFGEEGAGEGQFNEPNAIAFKSSGNMLVVDRRNDRVEEFTSYGQYLTKFGAAGEGNGQFKEPRGIVIGSGNTEYVTNSSLSNSFVEEWE
ncbi:MAG TPA: SMP-30/gluconolactonase/LRE family protein [Solirubrobacteraceae bacterium]|jgi:hypothetical protein|nr:SMP-30/gluconolactonase/LRE family protein [Solirubrobacteraceae bacterium]